MNRLINIRFGPEQVSIVLLILRIGVAGLMLVHGLPKLQMLFSGEAIQFPGVMGLSPALSLGLAVFAEVLCSLLILFGFATRLATIPLIITMLVAVFYIHATDPFTNQELGLHYLLAYIALLILGSGKYSVDAVLLKEKEQKLERAYENKKQFKKIRVIKFDLDFFLNIIFDQYFTFPFSSHLQHDQHDNHPALP